MKYFVLAEALPTFTDVQNWIVDAVLTFIWIIVVILIGKNIGTLKVKGAVVVLVIGGAFTWAIKNPDTVFGWIDGFMELF
ncbi:TPA: TcpD family membrane protein [Listeria monocytogenes]